jgi:hypothetical protein
MQSLRSARSRAPNLPVREIAAPESGRCLLASAILRTLAYADLFDYPLTAPEITRYLIGCVATEEEVVAALTGHAGLAPRVAARDGAFCLAGREAVFALRAERRAVSAPFWRRAQRYGALLGRFPFVRMVAVTGALAMENVAGNPDIDLLVIAEPGRVWICRRLLVLAVRAIRLRGDEICPNFVLASDHLALADRDLFTAHELAQMRPLTGYDVYQAMLAANDWATAFLPNAGPWPASGAPAPGRAPRWTEAPLRAGALDRWERWELGRLARKLGASPGGEDEVACTPAQCKGHTGHYRARVLRRYEQRLAELDL